MRFHFGSESGVNLTVVYCSVHDEGVSYKVYSRLGIPPAYFENVYIKVKLPRAYIDANIRFHLEIVNILAHTYTSDEIN